MGLLDGDLSAAFGSVFGQFYLDAQLYRANPPTDDGGTVTQTFADPETVKAQRSRTTQRMMEREGYVDTDIRILILASGVEKPDTDAELVFEGQRWAFRHVGRDPVGAYYDCHGRLAATQPS